MTTEHIVFNWVAGDDWRIDVTLLDQDGNPFNLTGTEEILWTLMDQSYRRILDVGDFGISITNGPTGQCSILIPATKTSPLPAGRYTDVIRIITGGITSTLSFGSIFVQADPWLLPAVMTTTMRGAPQKLRIAARA
jgi:hypothetical protein